MTSDTSYPNAKTCEGCANSYPEQVWVTRCIYFKEKYGTPCDKHMTEHEKQIKKLEEKRDKILNELKELYDTSPTTIKGEEK